MQIRLEAVKNAGNPAAPIVAPHIPDNIQDTRIY
jgi:hypothetical protein